MAPGRREASEAEHRAGHPTTEENWPEAAEQLADWKPLATGGAG